MNGEKQPAAIATNETRAGRREWIGLAVIALPCMLYSMDLTVLNLAVPALSRDLKPSSAQLLWIIDIYGFLVAGALITMGTLGDRIGRRRLLLIGATAFGVVSVLAAFARSAETLIMARALLGLAGATLAPSTLSLIRNMFHDSQQRTAAIGVWITSYSVGAAIGPFLGGLVLQYFSWGSVFLLGVPVMVLLLVLGPILLPEFRDPNAGRLDLVSAAMSLAAVLLVILGLKEFAQDGLGILPAFAVAVGLALGLAFLRRQRALPYPLIDLTLFRSTPFNVALALYMLATFVAFGAYVFTAQYLQLVLGLSPLVAGLWTLPGMFAFIVGSNVTAVLVRRFRRESVLVGGMAIAALGFALLTRVDGARGFAMLVAGTTIYSLGLSPVFTLTTDLIIGNAPPERAGSASALSETSSELGGALGIAILGSIGTAVYRGRLADAATTGVAPATIAAARSTLGGAVEAAETLPAETAAAILVPARDAFTEALQLNAGIGVVLIVAMAVATAIVLSRRTS